MPLKKTIISAGIVALLLLLTLTVILLLTKNTEEQPTQTAAPEVQYFFDLNDIDCISQISFTYQKNESVSVSKVGEEWQITHRPGLPVEDTVISDWLDQLSQMLALRSITDDCHDLTEYGFHEPTLTLTIVADDREKTYRFGSYNSHFDGYYCMVKGSSSVYLLEKSYVDAYDMTVMELLKQEELPVLSLPLSVQLFDSSGNETSLSADDQEKLGNLLSTLAIDRLIDYGTERYGVYGLDNAAVFSLTRADGTPLTYRISEGETEELIYLTMDEKELIYLVTCEDMQTLLSYLHGAN